MTEDELKALTDHEMRQAVGYFGGRLANMRQKALWYYEGLAKGDLSPPEIEGRSSVVATEVRNVILSVIPTLMEKFASGDNVVECSARKEANDGMSQDATDYLNWVFYEKNNGYRILETAFFDALISKAGIVKVWWDTRTEETREEYKGLSDVELSDILDDEEVEAIEHNSYPDEEAQDQKQQALNQIQQQIAQLEKVGQEIGVQQLVSSGQPVPPQVQQGIQQYQMLQAKLKQVEAMPVPNLHDVTVKRSKKGGKISIENVPPEEFLISRKAKSLHDAPFVGHRVTRTQSELKSMGYKNVEDITSDESGVMQSMERVERLTWDDDLAYLTQTDAPSFDPAQRNIVLTECYLRCDFDGDGISELRKVVRAGNTILENEEVDYIPFSVLRPIIMPHRFFGLSMADLAMEPQRIKTNILRAILDNMHFQTNGRFYAVEGQVNLDDLLTSRPGGVVRIKTPGAVGRLEQGVADPSGAMNVMQYMQAFTEEATGWNRTANASDNPNSLNLTATAANLAANKASQRIDMIARSLSEGLIDMFRLVFKLICQHQDHVEEGKINGRWVNLNPREWANMFDITLNVGLGNGSKDQQVQHLSMLLQHQAAQLQAGIGTVNPENVYKSNIKLASALGFRNPEIFWTDPAQNPPPKHPDPNMAKIQADQQKAQAQMQLEIAKHQAEMQTKTHEQEMQARERQREIELESQRDAVARQHEAEVANLKAQNDYALEQHRIEFDRWKAQLDAETRVLVAQIAAQAKVSNNANTAADSGFSEQI